MSDFTDIANRFNPVDIEWRGLYSPKEVKQIVEDFVRPKPRSICICDSPSPSIFDDMYWTRCINCNQWLSIERCVDENINVRS
jgi:hypothetical protein